MFFMIKREKKGRFEPIELLNFIHDEQLKRLKTKKYQNQNEYFGAIKEKFLLIPIR